MFSKEQLQRFSIRKLTVGTASVLIGVLFLTSWNTNNVYADSRNVTSGESIAKNNNPQEGNPAVNKDNVQIIDNNSTEVSNISDSKSSKVIKSDATKSDIVRDKTTIDDNSRTKVPELTAQANNKQALTTVTEDNGAKVSKTEKYSNSDIKNQSRNSEKTQETTLVKKVLDKEKLSSESLIDQKKLDGKVEIPATDPSNTITATDPSNYPKLNGLIGEDKYIYQVLSLEPEYWYSREPEYWYSRSKLILSVNRNDPNDKNIYAYVIDGNYNYNDGNYNYNSVEKSITIGMDKSSIITIDGREYRLNNNGSSEVSINGKTVSTQNSSTVTSKPRYLDNLPISQDYGLGNTSNGNCSAIGEIVPVFTKNSVIKYYYRDNEGNLTEIENSPNVTVNGFTGQEFEINDVGQYKKLILGYYLTSAPTGNFKGTLSQFSGDKYYKKVYYDFDTGTVEYSVLYHQISPDGTMEVGLFDANGYPLTERRVIAPNSSTEFSKYNLTVRNPYVTAAPHEVQFIYKKLGSIIPVDENENPIGDTIQFENNSKDPTKALPGKVPSISGYTPSYELVGDKKVPIKVPISVGDKVVPTDPGENIKVVYTANAQTATITYIDDDTTENKTLGSDKQNGKFNQVITFEHDPAEVIKGLEEKGYKLVSNNFDNQKYNADNSKNQFEVHFSHQTQNVKRNDTVSQTIHYVYDDGTKAEDDNAQTLSFEQHGVQDMVTHDIIWTPSDSQSFTAVTTPTITGYTPDVDQVDGHSVNFGDSDQVITVTYSANAQQAGIKFIDDTDSKTLDHENANGKFGDVIKFSRDVNDEISQFESQNYKLVSNNFDNQKYVSDNTKNQFEVHFVHVTKNVTRTDKVNRTIHYVYSDGKTAEPDKVQVVNFTEDGVQDLVTGNITWTSAKSQKMVSVDTPKLEGYTPDIKSVASQTVNFDDKDLDTTVTYSADAQQLDVAFIDDTTGKTLQTVVKNGHSDEQSGYNTKNDINNYLGEHYKLVSDSTNGNDLVFDHDDKADQHYEVHFVHVTKNVTRTDKVNRTIHYVYSDGKTAEPDKVQVVNFTEDGVQDLVTGNITWTSAKSQKMVSVDTPKLEGYTPDIKSVASQTVNFGDKDLDTTVTYSADAQTATITYIDDTNENKTLGSDKQNGKFNQVITFEHDPAEVIKGLEEKGYKLVSNDFNSNKYQADNSNNVFYVHLKHGTSESSRKDDVNMTVHYVMDDGSKAPSDSKQTVSFTKNGIKDNVTGNITWTPATSQTLKDVDSPVLTGYTADIKTANGKAVNFGDPDINVTVHYSANAQTAKITYIDDTTKTNLDSKEANGKFGQAITFEHDPAEVIKGLEEKGYVLVSNSFNKQTYDANNSNNVFYVHLKHGTKNVSRDHNVNMTVHYVMDDGSKAPSDSKQTVSFTESGIQDLVTQKITWTPADSQKFDDVVTPAITGYTPDQDKVAGQTANFDTQDRKVTVTYSPDIQLGRINYIDDNTGKTLTHDDFSGRTNEHEDYTPIDRIQEFENKGYELVSNDYPDGGFNFDDNDQQDQVFNVHLKHGTTTVTPDNPGRPGEPVDPDNPDGPKYPDGTDKTGLTDTVNRTITYVMIDGSKAPDAVHDSLSYTASKVSDKVNGEVLETKWSANQDFKDVDSPSVKGYTPDKKTVSNKNVAHDAADITETVKYSADAQKASVTYVDDKTGKTLKVDNLNGVTNAKSGYTTKAAIETYTGLGYTLVSDDTNGSEVVFDNDDAVDQAFTVHLSHGTITVTPENPGKPGEPVDPDNPDGPKYPDGTDEYQVKRTGTQTIHYVGANDKTPADNNQTFIFTREITFDNVTGNIISVTPWNVQSHTFGNVDTPVIPGYHADKAVAGGATVTPDDLNRVITVTYAPDGNPGNPGDQGDTPTPEPTPEPDPTPNPTPDDQPDSEISSDEHFENVKAKDKLDKTNPKKMDAYKKERKIIKTKIAKQDHTEIAEPKLPQTGEADNSIIGLLGMLLASFAAMFGFDSLHSHDKKHKN